MAHGIIHLQERHLRGGLLICAKSQGRQVVKKRHLGFASCGYCPCPHAWGWLTEAKILNTENQPRGFWSFERATRNSSSDKDTRSSLSRRRTRARRIVTQTQATARRPSPGSTGKTNRSSSLRQTIMANTRTPKQPARANMNRVALRPQSRRWPKKLPQNGLMPHKGRSVSQLHAPHLSVASKGASHAGIARATLGPSAQAVDLLVHRFGQRDCFAQCGQYQPSR